MSGFNTSRAIFGAALALVLAICLFQSTSATEYPSPPPVPARFESTEDLQRYLNQLHNYYLVLGRPRFGKRSSQFTTDLSQRKNIPYKYDTLFAMIDSNGDDYISREEFNQALEK